MRRTATTAYAIGITLRGVQSFGYRGTTLHSEAGCAFVIHPDEKHDGRAGTDEGFGYRILYIAPRLISEALGSRALPFVRDAVTRESKLHRAICAALDAFDAPIEDLRFDDSSRASPTRSPRTIRRRSGFLQRPRAPCGSRVNIWTRPAISPHPRHWNGSPASRASSWRASSANVSAPVLTATQPCGGWTERGG